ncbi:hypothetical protein [Thiolapillus sp.]|nr:hypothetical protein [Thiolapillus sp.]
MKRLLQETCAIVAKRQSNRLTENEYKNLQKVSAKQSALLHFFDRRVPG